MIENDVQKGSKFVRVFWGVRLLGGSWASSAVELHFGNGFGPQVAPKMTPRHPKIIKNGIQIHEKLAPDRVVSARKQ